MTVRNLPEYAGNYPFWVVRHVDGEFWFWGAYSGKDRAKAVALDVDGYVWDNTEGEWTQCGTL